MKRNVISFVVASMITMTAVSAALSQGAVGGPKLDKHVVQAFDTDQFTVWFDGGEIAEVVVSGDGDTDLDLEVLDKFGNLVASDVDPTDDCIVSFVPKKTAPYTIRVKNLGRVYNRYYIATN